MMDADKLLHSQVVSHTHMHRQADTHRHAQKHTHAPTQGWFAVTQIAALNTVRDDDICTGFLIDAASQHQVLERKKKKSK